jgi:hypothetical protein
VTAVGAENGSFDLAALQRLLDGRYGEKQTLLGRQVQLWPPLRRRLEVAGAAER